MGKVKNESARHSADRLMRLERRMRTLLKLKSRSITQTAEISAIEWALPILEKHIVDTYGELPPQRYRMFKHEYRDTIQSLIERDGIICYLCDNAMLPNDMTIDHVSPLSRGGLDEMTNYKLVHNKCNVDKGNMTLGVYLSRKKTNVAS